MTDHIARQAGITEALHYLQMGIANLELGNGVHMIDFRNAERAILAALAPFQERVQPWMLECFGAEIASDRIERNHRFFEEATELVQSNGMTRSEAHQLVDYTFDRPLGALHQEVGGVMVTLAALCLASGADMHAAGETELARIWTKVEQIRAKQAAKPKHSPLPAAPAPAAQALTSRMVQQALSAAWNDFTSDTGCYPSCFEVKPGKRIEADFERAEGAFLDYITDTLNAARQQSATPARIGRVEVKNGRVQSYGFEQTDIPSGNYELFVGATPTECTCPSGNGSLRHPCPVHPADAASDPLRAAVQAAVDLMEAREWAEHFAECHAPGDELASRLEACITTLHNEAYGGEDRADAASEADNAEKASHVVCITATELLDALELAAPDAIGADIDRDHEQMDTEMCIGRLKGSIDDDGSDTGPGLFAWYSEYPEEGVMPLRLDRDTKAEIDAILQRERQQGADRG
ncbi:hypothetical protein [Cupriavidus pauculus]|uniref:hypothetical protein n=1 Tax=Cupriavidus pauculus TaxID=82633 RepID=UPI000AA36DDB|nr:hypothetical protein [Cupriavidus pauculus]